MRWAYQFNKDNNKSIISNGYFKIEKDFSVNKINDISFFSVINFVDSVKENEYTGVYRIEEFESIKKNYKKINSINELF